MRSCVRETANQIILLLPNKDLQKKLQVIISNNYKDSKEEAWTFRKQFDSILVYKPLVSSSLSLDRSKNDTKRESLDSVTKGFSKLDTGAKKSIGVASANTVITAADTAIPVVAEAKVNAIPASTPPVAIAVATAVPVPFVSGLNGRWRSTIDGDQIAVLDVEDDLGGTLCVKGFAGGHTSGK